MFPNDPVSGDLTMSSSKLYVISHGLGPHFHSELVADVQNSKSFFTLEVDETTTVQLQKQFDMHVRYWSQ